MLMLLIPSVQEHSVGWWGRRVDVPVVTGAEG